MFRLDRNAKGETYGAVRSTCKTYKIMKNRGDCVHSMGMEREFSRSLNENVVVYHKFVLQS